MSSRDLELLMQWKGGNLAAFRQLVERHKDASFTLACSILKDRHRADDILQEVFLKIYTHIDSFKLDASFSTWVYRIVVNTCYDELKKNKDTLQFDEVAQLPDESESAGNPLQHIENADQKKYINLALDRINPDQTLVLRLFYLFDLNVTEIAQVTSFSVAKIKVDLHRGRANVAYQLNKILGKEIGFLL